MLFRRSAPGRHTRRSFKKPGIEFMEGRTLLSLAPVISARTNRPTAAQISKADQAAKASSQVIRSGAPPANTPAPTIGQQGEFAVNTVYTGYRLTHSDNVQSVGERYGKLLIAHDTRKVAGAYISAAFKGDGKTLDQLGHTKVVKEVGQDFSKLSQSPAIRYVGNQFSSFGKSVASQFNKLFGGSKKKS